MIHWPGAVIQKFTNRFQPAVQNQFKAYYRPEEIPTGADTFDAADSADEDLRRRQEQAATRPGARYLQSPIVSAVGAQWTGRTSLLSSPETRALVSNVFKGAVNQTSDLAREEAPRVAEDLSDKEYEKKREKRRQSGLTNA